MPASSHHRPHSRPGEDSQKNTSPPGARPYRSHRIPACDFCRRRKSRCTRDLIDRSCLLCRLHAVNCTTSIDGAKSRDNSSGPPLKRRKRPEVQHEKRSTPAGASRPSVGSILPAQDDNITEELRPSAGAHVDGAHSSLQLSSQEQSKHSGHIIGPGVARDAQVLEQYMSPIYNSAVSHARPNPYSVYSDDPRNPVVYMKVPRQRGIFPKGNGTPGFSQFETMEKILEPLGPDLLQVYFDNIHPSFPILDEQTVVEAYRQDSLPHALACEIYAVSLISWNTSNKLVKTRHQPPDIRYMWNLAVSGLNEDFLSPSFSTVLACLLDILGRPTTSITYNAINIGRAVALSLSLGLNRNPSSWKLDQRQKSLRIRTWWGLLIHDTWASLSHGTPTHTHRAEWDIPLPNFDSLPNSAATNREAITDDRVKGARSFIALCRLTEILGELLPLIYTLQVQRENSCMRSLRRLETSLDEWEDSLPEWLNPNSSEFQRKAPGALNLQLSFLAVKICMSRIALQETARSDEPDDIEARQYYLSRCRKAARAVLDFVISLQTTDTSAFWLPCEFAALACYFFAPRFRLESDSDAIDSAYHFTSAATLILRCALEAENDETARECVVSASSLLDRLRQLKHEVNWDLTDMCIAQCEDIVAKMSNGDYLDFRRRKPHEARMRSSPSDHIATNAKLSGDLAGKSAPENGLERSEPVSNQHAEVAPAEATDDGNRDGITAPEMGSSANSGPPFSGFYNPGVYGQGYQWDLENAPFLDLWQMPQMDGYGQFL